jgi:DNA-binding GntR family transcriptional regulator
MGVTMRKRAKKRRTATYSTIREKAYQYIQSRIASGDLESGVPISELLLAEELGSSRTPVREALGQLVAEGLLEQTPNRGTVVVRLTREDITDLYELREALEVYVVGKVARQHLRPDDLDKLVRLSDGVLKLKEELIASGESHLNAEQMNRFVISDRGFHSLLMAFSLNIRIRKTIDEARLLIRIFAMARHGYDAEKLADIHAQHAAIIKAIAAGESTLAMSLISDHIRMSMQERLEEFDDNRRVNSMRQSILGLEF